MDEVRRPGVGCLPWIRRTPPKGGVRVLPGSRWTAASGQPPHVSGYYTYKRTTSFLVCVNGTTRMWRSATDFQDARRPSRQPRIALWP